MSILRLLFGLGFLLATRVFIATADAEDTPVFRDFRVGVCTHFAFGGPKWAPSTMVPLITKLGVGWVRDELYWSNLETKPGVYAIPADSLAWIDAVHAAGIKIDLIFGYENLNYPNKYDPQAYARAAAWVAAQLRGKIDAIEIWNEPENFGFSQYYDHEHAWSGLRSDGTVATYVGKYVELLNGAAKAIRAANPVIKIIGLGCSPGANFHALAMGITPEVDGMTDHPYSTHSMPELIPFDTSPTVLKRDGIATADAQGTFASQLRMYRERSAQFHGPNELWLTEQGWPTYTPTEPFPLFAGFSRDAQARYCLRRLIEARALGVTAAFIYDLRDDGTWPSNQEENFGLLDAHDRPKPSYDAVRRLCAVMAGAEPAPGVAARVSSATVEPAPIPGQKGLSGADALRSYSFLDRRGEVLLALWDAKPADGKFAPVDATVTITGVRPPSVIEALDPLTGITRRLAPDAMPEGLVLKGFPLSNSPTILTLHSD